MDTKNSSDASLLTHKTAPNYVNDCARDTQVVPVDPQTMVVNAPTISASRAQQQPSQQTRQ